MAEICLVRHGQASFGADDYDNLSSNGVEQCVLLGRHLRGLAQSFDYVVIGAMRRHRQSVDALFEGLSYSMPVVAMEQFNEYNFQGLLAHFERQFPDEWQCTGHATRDYYQNMQRALNYWAVGEIDTDTVHTWKQFRARVVEGFMFACNADKHNVLVVSSGGPIAVILGHILSTPDKTKINLSLQIKNSSTHKILHRKVSGEREFTLDSYNNVDHINSAENRHLLSFS